MVQGKDKGTENRVSRVYLGVALKSQPKRERSVGTCARALQENSIRRGGVLQDSK